MTGLPILDYELKFRSRQRRSFWWRMLLTGLGTIAVLGMLQVRGFLGFQSPAETGHALFLVLAALGTAYCLAAGPVLTADCFSSEKRAGTLPLLFLTALPPSNIVLGRLASSSLPAVYALFAFLPLPAFGFFLGGVTGGEVWRLTIALFSLLLASLVLAGLVSALSWSGRQALLFTVLGIGLWSGLPWVFQFIGNPMPLSQWFPDPLGLIHAGLHETWKTGAAPWLQRLFVLWLATACGLIATTLCLPRLLAATGVKNRPTTRRHWRFGSWRAQSADREKWYQINPVAWVARQRTPPFGPTLAFLVVFGGTGLLALNHGPFFSKHRDVFLLFIFGLHGTFKLWLAWETSRCLSRDQSEGLLEPLLAAPLTEHQIVHGWISGLQAVFRRPLMLLLGMDIVIWITCDLGDGRLLLAAWMGVLLFDSFTLLWTGLLLGLLTPNATRGLLRTIGLTLMLPWVLGLACFALLGLIDADFLLPRHAMTPAVAWVIFSLLTDAILCGYCSHRLGGDFRHLVAERQPR